MDENVRRVLSEVGPYSDKDSLPGVLLIFGSPFGSLNYLKMHIIIIITGLQVTSRRPCWCGEEQKHFSPLGTLFSCKSLEITFIVLTTRMAANCDVVAN